MPPISLHHGLEPRHIPAAAALYWQAFGPMLGPVMGPERRAMAWLTAALNPAQAFTAVVGDRLIGLAGISDAEGGFVEGGLTPLTEGYGRLGGWWRGLALRPFERQRPAGELGLEGLCVHPEWRGRGVGTALLGCVTHHAQNAGYARLVLDVTDINGDAARLYERHGFEPTWHQSFGPLGRLYGVQRAQRMERAVSPGSVP